MSFQVFNTKFYGKPDNFQQRTGLGIETFCYENFQKYKGDFLQDNIHGKGHYSFISPNECNLYETTFYTNLLHGYCNVYYGNGEFFEGLYNKHRRFGPGIFTHSNKTQDVGIWLGHSLIRLNTVVRVNWVPSLACSSAGKAYLLKFRNVVSVEDYYTTPDERIMQLYTNIPELREDTSVLCNKNVSNPESLSFFKRLHDEKFYGKDDYSIDVLLPIEGASSLDQLVEFLEEMVEEECVTELENLITPLEKLESYLRGQEDCQCTDKCMLDIHEMERMLMEERDKIIENLKKKEPISNEMFDVQKVYVTALLSWNNTKLYEDILKFCFKCRKLEENVNFQTENVILGDRDRFYEPGEHEKMSREMLMMASDGKFKEVSQLIVKYDVNPDVADLRGNTGIFFAAARDQVDVLKTLAAHGATLNLFNNEGFTPLTMCICRYIAHKFKITDWERAFLPENLELPENDDEDVVSWRVKAILECESSLLFDMHEANSLEALSMMIDQHRDQYSKVISDSDLEPLLKDVVARLQSIKDITDLKHFQQRYLNECNTAQVYLFGLPLKKPPRPKPPKHKKEKKKGKGKGKDKKSKASSKKSKQSKKSKKSDKKKDSKKKKEPLPPTSEDKLKINASENHIPTEEELKEIRFNQELDVIFNTILELLELNADPNLGEVPLAPLHLAVFSKKPKVVDALLDVKANIDAQTERDGLTALHIAVCADPCNEMVDILKVLIKHNPNLNKRANLNHWNAENKLICPNFDIGDVGKNALHALAMRCDYFLDEDKNQLKMAKLLLENGINIDDLFLGHAALTLAMIRGNKDLVKLLLKYGVDPNVILGYDMGVPLTIFILKRFKKVLPVEDCLELQDLLTHYFANPLHLIPNMGNALEFYEKEYYVPPKKSKKGKGGKDKKGKSSQKSKSTKSKKSGKSGKSKKKKKGEDHVILHENLLSSARRFMGKFIKSQIVQYLYEFAMENELDGRIADNLAKFLTINDVHEITQMLCDNGDLIYDEELQDDYEHILDLVQYIKGGKLPTDDSFNIFTGNSLEPNPLNPEIDKKIEKYKVCFHCCKQVEKELLLCPKCCIVYFCSQECNVADSKNRHSLHPCHYVFYKHEKLLKDLLEAKGMTYAPNETLEDKLNIVRNKREAREKQLREDMETLQKQLLTLGLGHLIPKKEMRDKDILNKLKADMTNFLKKMEKKKKHLKGIFLDMETLQNMGKKEKQKKRSEKALEQTLKAFESVTITRYGLLKSLSYIGKSKKGSKKGDGDYFGSEKSSKKSKHKIGHDGGGDYWPDKSSFIKERDQFKSKKLGKHGDESYLNATDQKEHSKKHVDLNDSKTDVLYKNKGFKSDTYSKENVLIHKKGKGTSSNGDTEILDKNTKYGSKKSKDAISKSHKKGEDGSYNELSSSKQKKYGSSKDKDDSKYKKGDGSSYSGLSSSKQKKRGQRKSSSDFSSGKYKRKGDKTGLGKTQQNTKSQKGKQSDYDGKTSKKLGTQTSKRKGDAVTPYGKEKAGFGRNKQMHVGQDSYQYKNKGKPYTKNDLAKFGRKYLEEKLKGPYSNKYDKSSYGTKNLEDIPGKHQRDYDNLQKRPLRLEHSSLNNMRRLFEANNLNTGLADRLYLKFGKMLNVDKGIFEKLEKILNSNLAPCLKKLYTVFAIYFPEIQVTGLRCPFVCISNGQLYYQFNPKKPYYLNYSYV